MKSPSLAAARTSIRPGWTFLKNRFSSDSSFCKSYEDVKMRLLPGRRYQTLGESK